jgi:hypothetical protein
MKMLSVVVVQLWKKAVLVSKLLTLQSWNPIISESNKKKVLLHMNILHSFSPRQASTLQKKIMYRVLTSSDTNILLLYYSTLPIVGSSSSVLPHIFFFKRAK